MTFDFAGEAIEWRGPPPYVFVPVPPDMAAEIKELSPLLTYGWGCIPATVKIGATETTTALFPKNGGYLVPIKVKIQRAENVSIGDQVQVRLQLAPASP